MEPRPTLFAERQRTASSPYNAIWIITAPWAHPAWQQYALLLYDLTSTGQNGKPIIHRDGMTHEFMLYALDPSKPVRDESLSIETPPKGMSFLTPPNMAYQFPAASDEVARQRLQAIVDRIEAQTMSPDTDVRHWWEMQFKDGFSLLHSGLNLTAKEKMN